MSVCHVTSVHSRYDGRILKRECVSLKENGYKVSLIVNDKFEDEVFNGIKIISTKYEAKNRLKRLLYSQYHIKKKIQEIDADIYHLHDPELLLLVPFLKRRKKLIIFDSHENVGVDLLFKKYIPFPVRHIISKVYIFFERYIAKIIDGIVYVTPIQRRSFENFQNNLAMVTNFPLLDNSVEENEKVIYSKSRAIEKKICFAGSISEQWCHEIILKSILQIEDVKYSFAGPKEVKYLEDYLRKYSNKINYLGVVDEKKVADLYKKSICGIALLSYDTQVGHEGTLGNTKLFEYMKYRLPIICSDLTLWKEIIDTYKCGIAVNPTDSDEIIRAITFLIENPEIAIQMGNNGYKAYKEVYNWNTQIPNLLGIYTNAR